MSPEIDPTVREFLKPRQMLPRNLVLLWIWTTVLLLLWSYLT